MGLPVSSSRARSRSTVRDSSVGTSSAISPSGTSELVTRGASRMVNTDSTFSTDRSSSRRRPSAERASSVKSSPTALKVTIRSDLVW
jgi:hypothetical protein